jgi:hypothetical protein
LINNQITKIERLDNLINLQHINLSDNQITKMEGFDNLINLQSLVLNTNKITKIDGFDNLINLQYFRLNENQIKNIPNTITNLRNLTSFACLNNPIENISDIVCRFLNRTYYKTNVYTDNQSVHNHSIQESLRKSMQNLMKDTSNLSEEFIKYKFNTTEIHSTLNLSEQDIYELVLNRIYQSKDKEELLKILDKQIEEGKLQCFTGRITRLVSTLCGFFDDIQLNISDNQQIGVILNMLRDKYEGHALIVEFKKELEQRGFTQDIIEDWLKGFE